MRQHKKCSNIDLKITLGSCWQSSVLGDSSEGNGNIETWEQQLTKVLKHWVAIKENI